MSGRWISAMRATAGTAAVEFGIIAPILALSAVAAIEIGFALHASLQTHQAASAGAAYAAQNGFDAAGIENAVLTATPQKGLTASPSAYIYWGCPTDAKVVVATNGSSTICEDGAKARQYVQVGASAPRTSILSSSFGLPTTVSANATVRLP